MRHNDPPGVANLDPMGYDRQDLCRVPPNHCYILKIQALGLVVSDKRLF